VYTERRIRHWSPSKSLDMGARGGKTITGLLEKKERRRQNKKTHGKRLLLQGCLNQASSFEGGKIQGGDYNTLNKEREGEKDRGVITEL